MMNQSLRTPLVQIFGSFDQVLEWLFPQHCQGCDQKVKAHHANLCLFCWDQVFQPQRVIFPNRANCHIFSSGRYEELLKRMVILAKFKHDQGCTEILIELIKKTFDRIPYKIDVITAVPSDFWRSFFRGVDLPATIALELSKLTQIPFDPTLLKRIKSTKRQAKLKRDQRLTNNKKNFKASPQVTAKNVLIIDDIITTGSTVLAIDRSLQRQKPANSIFLTCAKVP